MQLVRQGSITSAAATPQNGSNAFPGVSVLPDGRWVVAWRAAPAKIKTRGQHVRMAWSDDEGETWSTPTAPFTPPEVDGQPGLFRSAYLTSLGERVLCALLIWVDHSDPALDFFNEETQGLLNTRMFLARSSDGGESWSQPEMLDTSAYRSDVPLPATGPILVLGNDDWACQFEVNKPYYETAPWRHSSVLLFSKDEGETWTEYSIAAHDPDNRVFYWDQRPSVSRDGVLLDLFWTYDNADARYLNIHARESLDHGRTWSPLWDIGVPGQPAPAMFLQDGRIAMAYVDRSAEPILKMRTSADGGRTWPDETEFILFQLETASQTKNKGSMQDAWAEMGAFSLGLPVSQLLPDGDVLTVFYAGPHQDETDILWVRVRP